MQHEDWRPLTCLEETAYDPQPVKRHDALFSSYVEGSQVCLLGSAESLNSRVPSHLDPSLRIPARSKQSRRFVVLIERKRPPNVRHALEPKPLVSLSGPSGDASRVCFTYRLFT